MTHFLAAGCFEYGGADRGHFDAYWQLIEDVAPFGIAPAENLWLQHLDRWYEGNICVR